MERKYEWRGNLSKIERVLRWPTQCLISICSWQFGGHCYWSILQAGSTGLSSLVFHDELYRIVTVPSMASPLSGYGYESVATSVAWLPSRCIRLAHWSTRVTDSQPRSHRIMPRACAARACFLTSAYPELVNYLAALKNCMQPGFSILLCETEGLGMRKGRRQFLGNAFRKPLGGRFVCRLWMQTGQSFSFHFISLCCVVFVNMLPTTRMVRSRFEPFIYVQN